LCDPKGIRHGYLRKPAGFHSRRPSFAARVGVRPAVGSATTPPAEVVKETASTGRLQKTPRWVRKYADNAALSQNFAPVENEISLHDLKVTGKLPPHLDGVYLRNGPNPAFEPIKEYHWFDGNGMVHWIRLKPEANSADYGCRYVQSRGYKEERAANKRLYVSITEPPYAPEILRGVASKVKNWWRPDSPYWVVQQINTANNGLTFHANRLLATYEAGSALELECTEELTCKGPCDFNGTWSTRDFWTQNFTAHPKVCPSTGDLIYIGYNLVPTDNQPSVAVGVVSAKGEVVHKVTLPCARPSMQHDVAITRTRTVLMDGPLIFNLQKSIAGGRPFDFDCSAPCRFGVMNRFGSPEDCVWVETDPGYSYHVMNAWDDPDNQHQVVLITCRMDMTCALGMADIFVVADDNEGATQETEPEVLKECLEEAQLHRYVINLESQEVVVSEPLADFPSDFPCVNPNFVGVPSRYGYTAGIQEATVPGTITAFNSVMKHDLVKGEAVRRPLGEGWYTGDITFVADPARDEEDAGHLLVLAHQIENNTAQLLVLDAQNIDGEPTAVVHISERVPFGFHCEYIPGSGIPNWSRATTVADSSAVAV